MSETSITSNVLKGEEFPSAPYGNVQMAPQTPNFFEGLTPKERNKLENIHTILRDPRVALEKKIKSYLRFRDTDYSEVPGAQQTVPQINDGLRTLLLKSVYYSARTRANKPVTENLEAMLPRIRKGLNAAGIRDAHVYRTCYFLATDDRAQKVPSFLAGIDSKAYDVPLDGKSENGEKFSAAMRAVHEIGIYIDELVKINEKCKAAGTEAPPTTQLWAFYNHALAYVVTAMEGLLRKPDDGLFSDEGIAYYDLAKKTLDQLADATEKLRVTPSEQPVKFEFRNTENGESRKYEIDISKKIDEIEALQQNYETRKAKFAADICTDYDKLVARATMEDKNITKQAIEEARKLYEESFGIPMRERDDYTDTIKKSPEFKQICDGVINSWAMEYLRDLVTSTQRYLTVLGLTTESANKSLDDIEAAYQRETGRKHPRVQHREARKKYEDAMHLENLREIERAKKVDNEPTGIVLAKSLKEILMHHVPKWAYAGIAAFAVAAAAMPMYGYSTQTTEGHIVGDVNKDKIADMVMLRVTELEPFTIQYSIQFGTKKEPITAPAMIIPPTYSRIPRRNPNNVMEYKPSTLEVIDECGDLLLTDDKGRTLVYQSDCKGHFTAPAVAGGKQ